MNETTNQTKTVERVCRKKKKPAETAEHKESAKTS